MKKGANLECILFGSNITKLKFQKVINGLSNAQSCRLMESEAVKMYSKDGGIIPVVTFSSFGLDLVNNFINLNINLEKIIVNLTCMLFDVEAGISVNSDFTKKRVVISTPEAFIWEYDTERHAPLIDRLSHFFSFCKLICDLIEPYYILVVNEGTSASDFLDWSDEQKENHRYTAKSLGQGELHDLYNWYTKEYI